ncbi:MAG: peptide ABC transporter substrate-binding protein [Patescibacteria group bacterium]
MSLFRDRSRSLFNRFSRAQGRRSSASLREQSGWDKRLVHSLTSARLPTWRQIRHLPEVLSSNDSFRLRLGTVLFSLGLVLLGVRYYYAHTEIGPAVGGEIAEAVVGTPRSLNPILSVSNDVDNDLTRLLFSRLFTTDGAGRVVPDLVERYDISSDQKTYAFTIRENARWHDGEPLTADDVIFTFALIQDPAWKSPLQALLKDVKFEKTDERTIALTLAEPYAQFLSRLNFGILPRHVWKDVQPQDAAMAEASLKPIGSGPFKFADMRRDKRGFVLSYTVERNADYYMEAPYLEKLTFHFYPDFATALEALRKRQVQSLSFVPRDMRAELSGLTHVLPVSLELPQATAVFFNARNNDALKEKDVRRALTMAIDKVRILFDVLGGDGHPIDRPALPGMSATSTSPVPFRIDEAGALLDGLGWKVDPEDGLRKKDVDKDPKTDLKTLSIALTTVDQPENLSVASIIRNGWAALGVEATVNAVPASEIHRTVIKPRAYEALLYGQLMGTDPDLYPFWHSSQVQDPGLNLAMFANKGADAALEEARRTADPAARKDAYRKFLGVLAEEVPAAFLYSPSYTYPMPAELRGFTGERVASPSDRFATVTSWYLETARVWKK